MHSACEGALEGSIFSDKNAKGQPDGLLSRPSCVSKPQTANAVFVSRVVDFLTVSSTVYAFTPLPSLLPFCAKRIENDRNSTGATDVFELEDSVVEARQHHSAPHSQGAQSLSGRSDF